MGMSETDKSKEKPHTIPMLPCLKAAAIRILVPLVANVGKWAGRASVMRYSLFWLLPASAPCSTGSEDVSCVLGYMRGTSFSQEAGVSRAPPSQELQWEGEGAFPLCVKVSGFLSAVSSLG